jgi:hypothetical protein
MPKSPLRQKFEYHAALAEAYQEGEHASEKAYKQGIRDAIAVARNLLHAPNTCASPRAKLSKRDEAENMTTNSIIHAMEKHLHRFHLEDSPEVEDDIPF